VPGPAAGRAAVLHLAARARRPEFLTSAILGLIQHLTGVEEHWFRVVFLGENLTVEKSMQVPGDVSAADNVTGR
jgi:hypothetical protein